MPTSYLPCCSRVAAAFTITAQSHTRRFLVMVAVENFCSRDPRKFRYRSTTALCRPVLFSSSSVRSAMPVCASTLYRANIKRTTAAAAGPIENNCCTSSVIRCLSSLLSVLQCHRRTQHFKMEGVRRIFQGVETEIPSESRGKAPR